MLDDTFVVIIILTIILILILKPEQAYMAAIVATVAGVFKYVVFDTCDTRERLDATSPDTTGISDVVNSGDASSTTTDDITITAPVITPDIDSSDVIDKAINDTIKGKPEVDRDADSMLAHKMQEIGGRSKEATLARTRYTSDNFRRFYTEELDEEEHRVWWDADMLDDEMVRDDTVTVLDTDNDGTTVV